MSEHTDAQAHPHIHHPNYVKVWAILSVLLVVSVVGPMAGIRVVTLITAFGVALVKAYLVARNFMHLNIEKPIVHWVLGLALICMVLLYAGVAPDVQKSSGQGWVKDKGFHYVSPGADHGKPHGASEPGSKSEPESKSEHEQGSSGH